MARECQSLNRCDSYEDQLRSLFLSCDQNGDEKLDKFNISDLCRKLQLEANQTGEIQDVLFSEKPAFYCVEFEEFKLALVNHLEKQSFAHDEPDHQDDKEDHREVGPKFVMNNRLYGRRSRPGSVELSSSDEENSDKNESLSIKKRRKSNSNDEDIEKGATVNDREYLLSIWNQLDVGKDGYLNRLELAKVCENVGMETLPEDVIDQLFCKLDDDRDGRVSFDELLSLFQTSFNPTMSKEEIESTSVSERSVNVNSSPLSDSLRHSITSDFSLFSALDTENNGTVTLNVLLEYFDNLGYANLGNVALNELGFNINNQCKDVDLRQLTILLEDEMEQFINLEEEYPTHKTIKAGLLAYQKELGHLRSIADSVAFERDKLRSDLSESNQRSLILAQEIDEQNARIESNTQQRLKEVEQRYVEQVRDLQMELSLEKDQHQSLTQEWNIKAKVFGSQLSDREAEMKEETDLLKKECAKLEQENSKLFSQLNEVKTWNESLLNELEKSSTFQKDFESRNLDLHQSRKTIEESSDKITSLQIQVEELKSVNNELRDKNDELNLELDKIKVMANSERKSSGSRCQPSSICTVQKSDIANKPRRLKKLAKKSVKLGTFQEATTTPSSSEFSSLSSDKSEEVDLLPLSQDSEDEANCPSIGVELGNFVQHSIKSQEADETSRGIQDTIQMGASQSSADAGLKSSSDVWHIPRSKLFEPLIEYDYNELASTRMGEEQNLQTGLQPLKDAKVQPLNKQDLNRQEEILPSPWSPRSDIACWHLSDPEEPLLKPEPEKETVLLTVEQLRLGNTRLTEANLQLEDQLKESNLSNVSLRSELRRFDVEMESVKQRLLTTLNEVDLYKENQTKDQERIKSLSEKCDELIMENRSLIQVSGLSPDGSASPTPSTSSSSSSCTISTSSKNNNVQIIAVRNENNSQRQRLFNSNSFGTFPSRGKKNRSNSPCISKIMVNSDRNGNTGNKKLSSASFSGLAFKSSAKISNHSTSSQQQPSSLPPISSSVSVKRSRSTSCDSNERSKVQVFQLEQHCKNLEGELDHVKDEIIKIISEKSNVNKENASLKNYVKAFEDLRLENEELRKELVLLKLSNPPKSPALSTSSNSSSSSSSSTDPQNVDRSSPDGQEYDLSTASSSSASSCYKSPEQIEIESSKLLQERQKEKDLMYMEIEKMREELKQAKDEIQTLKQDKEKGAKETENKSTDQDWEAKCKDLETGLEMMRNEFENMEDYWQGKLDEERKFYEDQLKSSDDNFKELELKMREYEELLLTSDKVSSKSNSETDKLSTIAETASMEGQVADLEEEISDLRCQLGNMQEQKYQLEKEWQNKLELKEKRHQQHKSDIEEQLKEVEFRLKETNMLLQKTLEENKDLSNQLKTVKWSSPNNMDNNNQSVWRPNNHQHQKMPSSNLNPQPSSLPVDLHGTKEGQSGKLVGDEEMKRLHELKSIVMQECEQLLMKRDLLRQDVLILKDIAKEKEVIESELVKGHRMCRNCKKTSANKTLANGINLNPVKLLQSRLKHQEDRCSHLQSALKEQQRHSQSILEAVRLEHRKEIDNLEEMMRVNKGILDSQIERYSHQMQRLATSGQIIKKLFSENETLITAIQTLESSIDQSSNSSCSSISDSTERTKECLEFLQKQLLPSSNSLYGEDDEYVSILSSNNSSSSEEDDDFVN